jgi:hypothetical protein
MHEPGTFALPDLQVLKVFVELLLVDGWADVGVRIKSIVDTKLFHARDDGFDKPIMDAFGDDEPARRRTPLARREKRTIDGTIGSRSDVGIV